MLLLAASGCAFTEEKPFETLVTRVGTSERYRFDIYGTPGMELVSAMEMSSLPVHKQIRLASRRYAEVEMARRGLCPNGFNGPDLVLRPKARMSMFFFVECILTPS